MVELGSKNTGLVNGVVWLIGVIALWTMFALPAGAQTTPPAQLDDATRGKLLADYATIAGGWYLEGRCNTLSPELKREFNWNVAQTNIALSSKTDANFLLTIQKSAKNVAENTKCGAEAQSLIAAILGMSRNTTLMLTGKQYSIQADAEYDANRIANLLVAQVTDDKCRLMPADVGASYNDRIQQITSNFATSVGSKVMDLVKARVAGVNLGKSACDQKAQTFLQAQALEARVMLGN